jgi:hypothetical protein
VLKVADYAHNFVVLFLVPSTRHSVVSRTPPF